MEMEVDNPEDLDDDWFYESIRRYKTLQMFHLQNTPEQLLQISPTSICVGNRNEKKNNTEILELKLPGKLTLPEEHEGRSKENDFKMLSGLYTSSPVYKMNYVQDSNRIITSEHGRNGLQVYAFSSSTDAVSTQDNSIHLVNWRTPNFHLNQENKSMVCSKCNHEPLVLMDLIKGEVIKEIKHPFHTLNILPSDAGTRTDPCSDNNIDCQFLNQNTLGIFNTNSGCLVMHDLRTENHFSTLPEIEDKHSKQIWTLSGYDFNISNFCFGILSNLGHFYIYDVRNQDKHVMHQNLDLPPCKSKCMKFKFSTGNRFSVSGFDSNVRIYGVENEKCELVFTHNGHSPKNECANVVTDHIWLPNVGDHFLISICDNKSLNCWEFAE